MRSTIVTMRKNSVFMGSLYKSRFSQKRTDSRYDK